MKKILTFSIWTINILCLIIFGCISIIRSDKKEKTKFLSVVALHSIIYYLIKYCYTFIKWTIRTSKFDWYPYRNPFCMLVIIYCIISFIVFGIYYIKYEKNKYGISKTILFLLAIHILANLITIILNPFIQ